MDRMLKQSSFITENITIREPLKIEMKRITRYISL